MRIRTIKPEFWVDSKTGSLSFEAKAIFIALLNYSDDMGVFQFNPVQIRAALFPYEKTEKAVTRGLGEIERSGLIIRFSFDSSEFAYIRNFRKHQCVSHPSKLYLNIKDLTPEKLEDLAKSSGTLKSPPEPSGGVQSPLLVMECNGMECNGIKNNVRSALDKTFDLLWNKYPAKGRIRKKEARARFDSSVKTKEDALAIVKALDHYLASDRIMRGYIQNSPTWFGSWRDWENGTPNE